MVSDRIIKQERESLSCKQATRFPENRSSSECEVPAVNNAESGCAEEDQYPGSDCALARVKLEAGTKMRCKREVNRKNMCV